MNKHFTRMAMYQKIMKKNFIDINDFTHLIFKFWINSIESLPSHKLRFEHYLNPNAVIIWSDSLCEAVVCSRHNAKRFKAFVPALNGHHTMNVKRMRLIEHNKVGALLIKIEDYISELPSAVTSLQFMCAKIQNPQKWNCLKNYPGIQCLLDALCFQTD